MFQSQAHLGMRSGDIPVHSWNKIILQCATSNLKVGRTHLSLVPKHLECNLRQVKLDCQKLLGLLNITGYYYWLSHWTAWDPSQVLGTAWIKNNWSGKERIISTTMVTVSLWILAVDQTARSLPTILQICHSITVIGHTSLKKWKFQLHHQ